MPLTISSDFFGKARRVFHAAPSLAHVPLRTIALAGAWMAVWYCAWLWLREMDGERSLPALLSIFIGFLPLLLLALFDYRKGLVLAVVATPFLVAPVIPHWFTQGFGDLFAVCAVVGFAARHPLPRQWIKVWHPGAVWLAVIIVAAVASLLLAPPLPMAAQYGFKYGVAEIAGYSLAIAFLLVLVCEIKNREDAIVVLKSIGIALVIVLLFALLSAHMTWGCIGGYTSVTPLTCNQAIMATVGNPNYFASYVLAALPLALLYYLRATPKSMPRVLAFAAILLLVFVVQGSMSRMGFLGLSLVWLGWLAITRWKPGTRTLAVTFGIMLPLTPVVWYYPACTCQDASVWACVPRYVAEQELAKYGFGLLGSDARAAKEAFIYTIASGKTSPKGWGDHTRRQLAKNAVHAWTASPATGVGVGLLGNYSVANDRPNRAHNIVLTSLGEQGLVGVLAWCGLWLYLASRFWEHRHIVVRRNHPVAFLLLSFLAITMTSMFVDQYRAIWLWQVMALVLVYPRMFATDKSTLNERSARQWKAEESCSGNGGDAGADPAIPWNSAVR